MTEKKGTQAAAGEASTIFGNVVAAANSVFSGIGKSWDNSHECTVEVLDTYIKERDQWMERAGDPDAAPEQREECVRQVQRCDELIDRAHDKELESNRRHVGLYVAIGSSLLSLGSLLLESDLAKHAPKKIAAAAPQVVKKLAG